MLPCRRLWPPLSWTSRHSGRSGAESITASMAAAVSRSGKRSGRLMPSRKWVPRKCSARGFMRTGSRRMLSTTTPSCIELIIWCERLRSPASSERYFSRSWTIRPCCAALSTTQMRFSGLLGLTRKSNAPWRVTSTAASTEARVEVITTTVRPPKRLMICSVSADPSIPGMDRGTRATSDGDSASSCSALSPSAAVRTMQPRRSRIRRSPSRIPSSASMTITRMGSRSHAGEGGGRCRVAPEQRSRRAHTQSCRAFEDRYCSILPRRCSRGTGLVSTSSTFIHSRPGEAPVSKVKPIFRGAAVCMRMGTLLQTGELAHLLAENEPGVVMLHHQVGNDHVGRGVPSPGHAFLDAEGGLYGVPVLLEEQPLPFQKIRIVIDDEYSRHCQPPLDSTTHLDTGTAVW